MNNTNIKRFGFRKYIVYLSLDERKFLLEKWHTKSIYKALSWEINYSIYTYSMEFKDESIYKNKIR